MTLLTPNILSPSGSVKNIFDRFVTPKVVEYGIFVRYVYARITISLPTINTFSYGLVIVSLATAITTYLFIAIIQRSIYTKLEPSIIPYELRPEATALVLKSSNLLDFNLTECKVQGTDFRLFVNINQLAIDPIRDLNHLKEILVARPDLVLLNAPENQAYLVQRDNEKIRSGIMDGTIVLHHLPPVQVPIISIEAPSPHEISQQLEASELAQPIELFPLPPLTFNKKESLESSEILGFSLADSFLSLSCSALGSHPSVSPPAPLTDIERTPPEGEELPFSSPGIVMLKIQSVWKNLIGHDHRSKEMKYRHILAYFYRKVTIGEGLEIYKRMSRTEKSPLKTKCLELYEIITKPENYRDIHDQQKEFIYALREAKKLLNENSPQECRKWIHFLALNRFTGIELYGYCEKLVESVSDAFDESLNLANFWQQLEKRNKKVEKISTEEGLPRFVGAAQNLAGHLNMKDFLIGSNVPYIYGQIQKGNRVITILRHGVPIIHFEPLGVFKRLWWGKEGNSIPEVSADYIAFLDAAHEKGQNILHIILENGDWKYHGDESSRVQARLALASKPNFYPLALRLDGDYFNPKTYQLQTLAQTKRDFRVQFFGKNTGFFIPGKLQQRGLTLEAFNQFMERIHQTFFSDSNTLDSLGDFQAFHLLTYAEMILSLCEILDITFLEALCKDDIDRGGVMKATIILLHLYHTGKFNPQHIEELNKALKELMVNIIAAPLIVKKKPILEKRSILISHVLKVLLRTVEKKPVPTHTYEGNFNVLLEPHQGLTPIGDICRSAQEYKEFLSQVRCGNIVLETPIDQNIVKECAQKSNHQQIVHQINRDAVGLNMNCDEVLLNPDRKDPKDVVDSLLDELVKKGQLTSDEAWEVLSAFTQTIGSDLLKVLEPQFNNDVLQYIIVPDNIRMETDKNSGLYLMIKPKHVSIKLITLFKIISSEDPEKIITRIRTIIEIPDHRIAGAMVTTTVDDHPQAV